MQGGNMQIDVGRLQEEIVFKANKVLNLYNHRMKNIVFPDIDNILKNLDNSIHNIL